MTVGQVHALVNIVAGKEIVVNRDVWNWLKEEGVFWTVETYCGDQLMRQEQWVDAVRAVELLEMSHA